MSPSCLPKSSKSEGPFPGRRFALGETDHYDDPWGCWRGNRGPMAPLLHRFLWWFLMEGRVFRKPSLQQQDRLPCSSYDDTLWRLVQIRCDQSVTDEAYYLTVKLVADIYWRSDRRVIADVRKLANQVEV